MFLKIGIVAIVFVVDATMAVAWWQPQIGNTWQWQLSGGKVNTSIVADIYDVDLWGETMDQTLVDRLHALGRRVICYISVGSWESYRPDANKFPASVLGKVYAGYPDEKWLDVRQLSLLAPIMRARLDLCKAKKFDAVEPDNMMVFDQDSGFKISLAQNLAYVRWLANEAHARGLAIGIKNSPGQVAELVDAFDFAIVESSFHYNEAQSFKPFIAKGKPVFTCEYTNLVSNSKFRNSVCPLAKSLKYNVILKNVNLTAPRRICP